MKFCRECNTQNSNATIYCSCCGANIAELQVTATSVGGVSAANAPSAEGAPAVYDPSAKDYSRLGGWLKFFVVMDFIAFALFPAAILLYLLLQFLFSIAPEAALEAGVVMPEFPWQSAFGVILLIIRLVGAVMIIRKDNRFLLVMQIYYIANLAYNTVWAIFSGTISFSSIHLLVVSAVVVPLLLTLYFCKSRRVNAYMGSDEYRRKALLKL